MTAARTILLAGATGFLGSRLARRLAALESCHLVVLKRNSSCAASLADVLGRITIYDIESGGLDEAFRRHRIEVVVNCVAGYGRPENSASRVAVANLVFPLQLLEQATNFGVRAFVNTHTSLPRTLNAYSLSKHQFTDWLRHLSAGLVGVSLRLEQFFGPGEDSQRFVSYLVERLLDGASEIPLTDGFQQRDFVYVDDVVDACLTVIDATADLPLGFHEFDVGSGQPVAVRDVVRLVQRLTGNRVTRLRFGARPYRPGEVMRSAADLCRLRELGWQPRVPLEEGLQRTIGYAMRQRRAA